MNRITKAAPAESPSQLMGTLAIMGFAAEDNLRSVAQALGQKDRSGLARVEERNEKQARLRVEVEEQIVGEMARPASGTRHGRKLILSSRLATMFERMGARTVEISHLCDRVLSDPQPSRLSDLKKLIEHAVYITDRAATGLVEEDLVMAKIAQEQKRDASQLGARIKADLEMISARSQDAPRIDFLCQVLYLASSIIEEAGRFADDVIVFLEAAEI